MSFNIDKCKVLVLNAGLKGLTFNLFGQSMELVTETKYLGVLLTRSRQTSLYGKHISQILEKAEARVNAIRHMGFRSDGLRPETSVKMYKILVRPMLEYADQVLSYKNYYFTKRKSGRVEEATNFIKKLENFQNKVLKKLVPCPRSTPPAFIKANDRDDANIRKT